MRTLLVVMLAASFTSTIRVQAGDCSPQKPPFDGLKKVAECPTSTLIARLTAIDLIGALAPSTGANADAAVGALKDIRQTLCPESGSYTPRKSTNEQPCSCEPTLPCTSEPIVLTPISTVPPAPSEAPQQVQKRKNTPPDSPDRPAEDQSKQNTRPLSPPQGLRKPISEAVRPAPAMPTRKQPNETAPGAPPMPQPNAAMGAPLPATGPVTEPGVTPRSATGLGAATCTSTISPGVPQSPIHRDECPLVLVHIASALTKAGAYAVRELPELAKFKGIDSFLDTEIDDATAKIAQALAQADNPPPSGAGTGGTTAVPVLQQYEDLCKTIGQEKTAEAVLTDLIQVLQGHSSYSAEYVRFAGSVARAVAKTNPKNLSNYINELIALISSPDVETAVFAAIDLGDVGARCNAADLNQASATAADPVVKAAIDAANKKVSAKPANSNSGATTK
jgi:hypothetical protein